MNRMIYVRMASCSLLVVAGLLTVGCGKSATKGPEGSQPATTAATTDDH